MHAKGRQESNGRPEVAGRVILGNSNLAHNLEVVMFNQWYGLTRDQKEC